MKNWLRTLVMALACSLTIAQASTHSFGCDALPQAAAAVATATSSAASGDADERASVSSTISDIVEDETDACTPLADFRIRSCPELADQPKVLPTTTQLRHWFGIIERFGAHLQFS